MSCKKMHRFSWLNESILVEKEGEIETSAPKGKRLFCNYDQISDEGIMPESLCNAPFFTKVGGRFCYESEGFP